LKQDSLVRNVLKRNEATSEANHCWYVSFLRYNQLKTQIFQFTGVGIHWGLAPREGTLLGITVSKSVSSFVQNVKYKTISFHNMNGFMQWKEILFLFYITTKLLLPLWQYQYSTAGQWRLITRYSITCDCCEFWFTYILHQQLLFLDNSKLQELLFIFISIYSKIWGNFFYMHINMYGISQTSRHMKKISPSQQISQKCNFDKLTFRKIYSIPLYTFFKGKAIFIYLFQKVSYVHIFVLWKTYGQQQNNFHRQLLNMSENLAYRCTEPRKVTIFDGKSLYIGTYADEIK
jgi:hypothetical protein